MKKIISFNILLLSCFISSQNLIAVNNSIESVGTGITVKIPSINTVAGKNISVPVETSQIDSSLLIVSYQFNLLYDNNKLEFKGSSITNTLSSNGVIEINSLSPGKLRIACIKTRPLKGLGNLLYLDFKVIDAGSSDMQLSDFLMNTDSVKNLSNGNVTVLTKYGDTDGNDFVQAYDAALVLQHSVGLEPLPLVDSIPWENWRKIASDVDLINDLTANDAGLILKKSIGLIDLFPAEDDNLSAMKVPQLNAADVTITKEWNNLIFRSYGNLIGLNITLPENFNVLDQPSSIDGKFMNATNINSTSYRIGLATANPPADGTVIMSIPIKESTQKELLIKLVINNQFKDIKANVITANEELLQTKFRIYPNPVEDQLNIIAGGQTHENVKMIITNMLGQSVYQTSISGAAIRLNLKNLVESGIYHIQFWDTNNQILYTQKLIIK